MGLLYSIGIRIMNFMVLFLFVVLLPGLPPRPTFPFKEFQIAPSKDLKGALEPNYHLEGAEHLLEGRVYGPECLIARKNEIYTGIHGGEVIKLTSDHVTHVVKLGQPCEDIYEEARCGRPLGLAFDTLGNNLIIADAYYGIWQVDLDNGKKKLLVSPQEELEGKDISRKAKVFNSVAVDKIGDIYWTDSSSDFLLQDLVYTAMVNPSGRLFKYDRAQNVSRVLLDELYFANGLVLSPQEDFVVVAETGAMRLIKYYLKGPKAGKSEVFVEGLPGLPDNITPDADGIWVPLVMATDSEHPNGYVIFSRFPTIRLFLARMLSFFELPFRLLNNVYPNKIAQRFIHFIGHGESILLLAPKRSTIVRLDWNGNIVGSLHGFDSSVGAVSHVLEFNDQLYLGSPFNRFLARVKSPQASKPPTVKIKSVRTEGAGLEAAVKPPTEATTAKPVVTATPTTTKTTTTTTTTKPTTTTPKPTTTTTQKATTTTPTTTTPKPTTTTTTTTTLKPTTTTTPKPTTTVPKPPSTTTPPPPPPKITTTTASPKTVTPQSKPPVAAPTPAPSTAKLPAAQPQAAQPKVAQPPVAKPPVAQPTAAPATAKQPAAPATAKQPATQPRVPPQKPAPVEEKIPRDTQPPKQEKLKVIDKQGNHVEL